MSIRLLLIHVCFFFIIPAQSVLSQGTTTITGKIRDTEGKRLFLVNVAVKGSPYGTVTNKKGEYHLILPANEQHLLVFSSVGFKKQEMIFSGNPGETTEINKTLEIALEKLDEVSISGRYEEGSNLVRLDVKSIEALPSSSRNVESLLKTLPGVASSNELSSQYSVRGGNFDENLVYVNDIEIYRPFLVRSGQQEGLSFINPDMVSSIRFSAGGFDAMYGDKMSSVLDVKYKKPTRNTGSGSASFLGVSAFYGGSAAKNKLTYLTGFRYKTTGYLLNSLDTKGEYTPAFTDFQTYITYDVSKKFEVSFLGNISQNNYTFIPKKTETSFGTVSTALNLEIFYDGNEADRFGTYLGALTLNYHPNNQLSLKLIGSGFRSVEKESFDILGSYLINELDTRATGSENKDSLKNVGVGAFLNHARNALVADVMSLSHIGNYKWGNSILKWGLRFKHEIIDDNISEWSYVDSTGYSVPYTGINIELYDVLKSNNYLSSNRITGYIQHTYKLKADSAVFYFNTGLRNHYWDLNNENLLSPRVSISFKPNWKRDMLFHLAGGMYYQPAFYKELRNPFGQLNKELKAQKSVHAVLGGDYNFRAWNRPFKFSTELYYKHLTNLVPYRVDNMRLEYAAENMATGYATGIDFKLNGEFVEGTDSWVSLSFMNTKESVEGDFYIDDDGNRHEPGYYARPTDQLMNFGLFFQDYLPNNPSYKVHLYFLFGSRLPLPPPDDENYIVQFREEPVPRMTPYRRVDIGFSKVLKSEDEIRKEGSFLGHFKSIWISAEIYNLFDAKNAISYLWLRSVSNLQNMPGFFAVPNYLTRRRYNIKLSVSF
ncbi:MAG: TonB-dependent receptor [Bacteroidota bacterium]